MGFKIYKKGELPKIYYKFQDPEGNINEEERKKRQEFVEQSQRTTPIEIDKQNTTFKNTTLVNVEFKEDLNIKTIVDHYFDEKIKDNYMLKALVLNDENSAFYMASFGLYVIFINLIDNSVSLLKEKEKKTFERKESIYKWGINTMVDIVLTNDMADLSDLYFFLKQGGIWTTKDKQAADPLFETKDCNSDYVVFSKPTANFYRQSINFNIYRHKVESAQTFERVNRSYSDLVLFNEIAQKYNIKYVAVSGTLLGLNRHGGMIVWDDDIDLGLLREDFQKVIDCSSIFSKTGLNLKRNLADLFKLGVLDIFLLTETQDGFYDGRCKTFCEKEQYTTAAKQIFAHTYVYAPINAEKTLIKRFGENYFNVGNPRDGFHGDKTIQSFNISPHDRCYIAY